MGDRYYDDEYRNSPSMAPPPGQYYASHPPPPPPQYQQQQQQQYQQPRHGSTSSTLDRGYTPPGYRPQSSAAASNGMMYSQQNYSNPYAPPNPSQYSQPPNGQVQPYFPGPPSSRPASSQSTSGAHRRHSPHSRPSKPGAPGNDEIEKRVKHSARKEFVASLIGAGAGGYLGHELKLGGLGTLIGVAGGAWAGDKFGKHQQGKTRDKLYEHHSDAAQDPGMGQSQGDLSRGGRGRGDGSDDGYASDGGHRRHRRRRSTKGRSKSRSRRYDSD